MLPSKVSLDDIPKRGPFRNHVSAGTTTTLSRPMYLLHDLVGSVPWERSQIQMLQCKDTSERVVFAE